MHRLQQISTNKEIKRAVRESFVDLHTLHERFSSTEKTPPRARGAANMIMVGILVHNGFIGRPGEWESLTIREVSDFVAGQVPYITFTRHKTLQTHGALGRALFPGTLQAMKLYLGLPHTHQYRTRFLEPP